MAATNRKAPASAPADDHPSLQQLRRVSHFMDSAIRLPGGYRIGWDGVIGLIPGIGDVAGAAVSAWIVMGAARIGAPKSVLLRMLVNMGLETVVGAIPIVGDIFDFVFKANNRNLRLLERHAIDPVGSKRHSTLWLLMLALVLVAVVIIIGWAVVAVLSGLLTMIF